MSSFQLRDQIVPVLIRGILQWKIFTVGEGLRFSNSVKLCR